MMDEALLHEQAAALGFRLIPERKLKQPVEQLARALTVQGIDAVIDVGANVGQYASSLRAAGWVGPILSIEPAPEAHAVLRARAADDPRWLVAPPMAIAERAGEAASRFRRKATCRRSSARVRCCGRCRPPRRCATRLS